MKIYVEGNIGAGKSTFVNFLRETYGEAYSFILEPVDTWTSYVDNSGKNLLDNFYRDGPRWCYTFQMAAFMTRIRDIQRQERSDGDKSMIIERSIYSDRNCFAELGYKNGTMNDMEWAIYNDWFNWLTEEFKTTIEADLVIYLQCPPETCAKRICKRNRAEECSIPLEYLTGLHERHEDMIKRYKERGVPVIVVDATRDIETDGDYFKNILTRLPTHTA